MARIKNQEVIRRSAVASRESSAPRLAVQADLDSSRGHNAISRASLQVLDRLGDSAGRVVAGKTAKSADEDQSKGAARRTQETVEGAPARTAEDLANETATFRRGYFLTEAANRLNDAKLNTSKRLAALRPGEDPQPIIEEELGALMGRAEFQDPTVLKQLAPAIQELRTGVLAFHQKTELAEIFESQVENLREMARADIVSGELLTTEGVTRFRAALNTEQFAFLQEDDADAVIAEAVTGLLETGELDPEVAQEFLKTRVGDRASLWDQGENASRFDTAMKAGAAVRQRAFEEQQANAMAAMEPQLQDRAGRGALSTPEINALADKLGHTGKSRLSFVRHWIDQNQTGLRRMESEAKEAARHREVIGAINAGAGLTHTTAQLQKAAQKEWAAAAAITDKDARRQAMSAVITRYSQPGVGVAIPQLKDRLSRTTAGTLTQDYALYEALSRVDPVLADRYLSDANATLFAQHHDNLTQHGMTAEESLRSLPTGANKGRRVEVAPVIAKATTAYLKDNPELPDGSPRPHWFAERVQRAATELALANPNASPEVNLRVAERRVMAGSMKINGQWVPRGSARSGTEPAIEEFIQRAAEDAVAAGVIDKDQAGGAFAAPHWADPSVFMILRPDGLPVVNPNSGVPVLFDPNEIASSRVRYEQDKAEARTRFEDGNRRQRGTTVLGIDATAAAAARTAKGTGPAPSAQPSMAALTAAGATDATGVKPVFEFPDFIDYFHDHKRKPAQGN